ncbi:MAG: hypothetical protein ACREMY_02125 [bacterium]
MDDEEKDPKSKDPDGRLGILLWVSMPPSKQITESSPLDELESPPIPRHTITVTIRSTLPQVG